MESPLEASAVLEDIEMLAAQDCIFIPGGHAPMMDVLFSDWLQSNDLNEVTGKLLRHLHEQKKTTAAICHGSGALGAAPVDDGKWIYDGYKMTCVPMWDEWLMEDLPLFKSMEGHMPDDPATILQRRGGVLKQRNIPGWSNVVQDRELITGQDPFAAEELGKRLCAKLEKQSGR